MLKGVFSTYTAIRKKFGQTIDRHVGTIIRRCSKDELKAACLDKNKAEELAAKVYFQLPEHIKKHFKAETKVQFINDVVEKLMAAKDTKKGQNLILDK